MFTVSSNLPFKNPLFTSACLICQTLDIARFNIIFKIDALITWLKVLLKFTQVCRLSLWQLNLLYTFALFLLNHTLVYTPICYQLLSCIGRQYAIAVGLELDFELRESQTSWMTFEGK